MALGTYRITPATIAVEPFSTVSGVTLSGAINDSDTTVSVSDASDLPPRGIITVESEEILYMGKSGNDLTNCLRGFHGTTAASHTSGTSVTLSYQMLGDTLGGVTVNQTSTKKQLKSDQAGESPIDESIAGVQVSVEANLAEITFENLAMINRTTVKGSPGQRRVEVTSDVGYSLLKNSKKVLIIPYDGSMPSNDPEDLFTILKGGLSSETSLTYDSSNQQVLKMTITGYVDTTAGNKVAVWGLEA